MNIMPPIISKTNQQFFVDCITTNSYTCVNGPFLWLKELKELNIATGEDIFTNVEKLRGTRAIFTPFFLSQRNFFAFSFGLLKLALFSLIFSGEKVCMAPYWERH